MIKKAVIPAAGLGTRFLPATKVIPKEMLPVVDRPALQYIVEEAIASGIEEILIITSRGKGAIEDHFDYTPELEYELEKSNKTEALAQIRDIADKADIHYVRQKNPKGLGHAISYAKTFVGNDPFAVLLGDDIAVCEKPALRQLMDVYEKYQASVIGVSSVAKERVSSYGVVDPDPNFKGEKGVYKVKGLVEKPPVDKAPSNVAIFGRYVITPAIFEILQHQTPGAGGEIQLTDALLTLGKKEDLYAIDFEGERYDVGQKIGFLRATVEFALQREDLSADFKAYLADLSKKGVF